jgi:hypothetical protein
MASNSIDNYQFIEDKQLLINKVIQQFSPSNDPVQWTGLFVIGYGVYEKVMKLFYLNDSGIICARANTRSVPRDDRSSLLHSYHRTHMNRHNLLRQTYAHGDFVSEDLAAIDYESLRNDLKNFKEALALVAEKINDQS